MKPVVLLGGGFNHYQVIQGIKPDKMAEQILLISEKPKLLPLEFLPYRLSEKQRLDVSLDLWTACQRKSVEYLEDRCLQINREEGIIQLESYGSLAFKHLSLETQCEPTFERSAHQDPSKIKLTDPEVFYQKLNQFFKEVHRHCPREVRVVMTGLTHLSIELAVVFSHRLQETCENCDIVILEEDSLENLSSHHKKQIQVLKKKGVRVLGGAQVIADKPHCLELEGGQALSYDILIPLSHWQPKDFLGRLLQSEAPFIEVEEDLSHISIPNLSVCGKNVLLRKKKQWLSAYEPSHLAEVLLHNIFSDSSRKSQKISELRQCYDPQLVGEKWKGFSLLAGKTEGLKAWQQGKSKKLEELRSIEVLDEAKKKVELKLKDQADHMSRPWRGKSSSKSTKNQNYVLTTFHGFNSWGNHFQSTLKICEMALLKSLSRGMKASHLRFFLTLPSQESQMTRHIFETTLHSLESFCESQGIAMDGGDTFNGSHWQLCVTLGGEPLFKVGKKMNSHDYLLMTRPLGYGILWAGRLESGFDSRWIQQTLDYPLLFDLKDFQSFIAEHEVSAAFVVEEWGFLYHCLRHIPTHHQMILNFREVPRWEGTDSLFHQNVNHPGIDANWPKVAGDVAFKREDVSRTNSVLWDSMSQGSLVFGVSSKNWVNALKDLKARGYSRASLVGCTRPKKNGQRVVLSDWSPS